MEKDNSDGRESDRGLTGWLNYLWFSAANNQGSSNKGAKEAVGAMRRNRSNSMVGDGT